MTSTESEARPDGPAAEAATAAGRHDAALRELAGEQPLRLEVRGSSMEPLLVDHTMVDIAPVARYWPGDVVAFRRSDGRLLVHRVVGYMRRDGRFKIVLQGDAMGLPDAPVDSDRILGRVCGGNCDPRIARPSVTDRLTAVLRFARAGLRRLLGT